MKKLTIILLSSISLLACNGGGSSSSSGGGGGGIANAPPIPTASPNYSLIVPAPFPTSSSFESMPNNFSAAIPSFAYGLNSAANSLQIAYGHNTNPVAPSLVAYVNMYVAGEGTYICSATPVAADGNGGTWLVGAAHCFLSRKSQTTMVGVGDVLPSSDLSVRKGIYGNTVIASTAEVFIRKDYCSGGAFSGLGECPNFSPIDGAFAGQGNDIALIHINSKFNSNEAYPQLARAESYPQPYTMAPVLSMGFGDNNVNGGNGDLFYVVNYFYQQSDKTGYHYLYNSYFNPDPANFGYSSLICGGDSGGPDLFWNGSNWLLLSEHTYGPSGACGQFYNDLPNGATNVSTYYDWLTGIINSGASGAVAYCNGPSANCVTNGS